MKKLIIAAFILLATTAETFAGPILTITVEFGHKDANGNCVERGICKITVGGSRSMTATVNDNTGNLELTIIKSASQVGIVETQFINGVFEVPAGYSLSQEVTSKLGIDKFTIKAGKYKVEETRDQYKIVFQK